MWATLLHPGWPVARRPLAALPQNVQNFLLVVYPLRSGVTGAATRSAMRPGLVFFFSFSCFVAGCGGAQQSDLLQPADGGGGGGRDVTSPPLDAPAADEGARDSGDHPDRRPMKDAGGGMDVEIVDTGVPDTGPKYPPVDCCTTTCPARTSDCCVQDPGYGYPKTFTCETPADPKGCSAKGDIPVLCDEAADCPGEICCGQKNAYDQYQYVVCAKNCGGANQRIFCNPSDPTNECASIPGYTCQMSTIIPGYYVCLPPM